MGDIPVPALLSSACTSCQDAAGQEQSSEQAVRALVLHQPSRVSGACDGALPLTPPASCQTLPWL